MSDFLEKLGKKAESQLKNPVNPYHRGKEPTRSVQVRDSVFKRLKLMAVTQDTKIVDLVDDMLRKELDMRQNSESKK